MPQNSSSGRESALTSSPGADGITDQPAQSPSNAGATSPSPITPSWFLLAAGAILAFAGTNHILDTFLNSEMLTLNDPLLGFPFRYELLVFGLVELLVAWLSLFTNKRNLSLGLVAWLAFVGAAYRIGLSTLGWPHPWVFLGDIIGTFNISPLLADIIISAICAFLLIGSGMVFWFGRPGCAATAVAPFLKMSCPSCGVHIRFAVQNLGQSIACPKCKAAITLRRPEELIKILCFFCKGHIEFPSHAIGTKMACPHCKMDITLKGPTESLKV